MKDDKVYLISILEAIESIQEYTKGGKEEFIKTKIIIDAVIRNLEIIGEASKKISHDIKKEYSEMPWRQMAGLRDVLIHDYLGVDKERVWNVIENELSYIAMIVLIISYLYQVEWELEKRSMIRISLN